jgi:hypothetical protein
MMEMPVLRMNVILQLDVLTLVLNVKMIMLAQKTYATLLLVAHILKSIATMVTLVLLTAVIHLLDVYTPQLPVTITMLVPTILAILQRAVSIL